MLEKNQNAPEFSVINARGESVSLSKILDTTVVLYFYPKDDTSGCTIQANEFTALKDSFADSGAVVYGISKDDTESHCKFIDKFNLTVELLSDLDGAMCEAYSTWGEKEKNGVKKMGLIRSTFVIDKSGVLRYVEYGVSAKDHAGKILEVVKGL
ncbi:MAG: peroxiredoxin [Ectothiorhodospiraceae bacterium]|nr:peroxiredoxin [Ectothiorhodospiraceae bacterium]